MNSSEVRSWFDESRTAKSARIQQAIMTMQDSLRQYDIERCEPCFRALQGALDTVMEHPDREESALKGWTALMRVQQFRKGCDLCQPPVF